MGIEIKSSPKGAELISILVNGKECLHQGEKVCNKEGKAYWKRHAPVLFPIVGRLKEDTTLIEGRPYKMSQHGFARDMEFSVVENTNKKQEYLLISNEITKEKYPYEFRLTITHEVIQNKVKTTYQVENIDTREIIFGIGGHPAYQYPLESECYLEFEKEETKVEYFHVENGLLAKGKPKAMENEITHKILPITKQCFQDDAIIMKGIVSDKVSLKSKKLGKTLLSFSFPKFPNFAIWSKPEAPFICLEPWYTTADSQDSVGILKEKEGILIVKPKEIFTCAYEVEFF